MMWRRRARTGAGFESQRRWAAIARRIARVFPMLAFFPVAVASEEPAPAIEPPSFEGRFDETGLLEPCTGPDDWVHLTSSEWLHGRINIRDRESRNPKFAQKYALYIQRLASAKFLKKRGLVLPYRPPVFRCSIQIRGDRGAADLIPVRHSYTEFLGTFCDRECPYPY